MLQSQERAISSDMGVFFAKIFHAPCQLMVTLRLVPLTISGNQNIRTFTIGLFIFTGNTFDSCHSITLLSLEMVISSDQGVFLPKFSTLRAN